MEQIFVNARRNKKRERKIQASLDGNTELSSKFYNMTRLLMYKIVKLFKDEQKLQNTHNMSSCLADQLRKVANKIKQHSRDTCKSSVKTNFYTHSHYNALFLILNENNLKTFKKSQKDVDTHQFIFGLDLLNITQLQLTFANLIKSVAYEIVKLNMSPTIKEDIP